MPAELSVGLLGETSLTCAGEPLRFVALPKSLPLLAYLLLHRGIALQRDNLAFLMWPDETESEALSNLRRHLHRVSRALPPAPARTPWLRTTRTTVWWNIEAPCRFDVAEFERLAAADESLVEAAALYRGDFLPACFDDWAIAERERLRGIHSQTLARLIARFRRDRDFPRAAGYANAACRLDPYSEHALRTAMSVRHEYGDRSGALAEFERFVQRLRAELDTEPMPETIALYDQIARDSPAAAETISQPDAGPGEPRVRGAAAQLAFVGRRRELARLERAWGRAALGRGVPVMISGEAGIGKSRLAFELSAIAEAQGGTVFAGTTSPLSPQPYQPFAEALRAALPVILGLDLDDVWLAAVGALVPEALARRPNLVLPERLDDRRDQLRLFEAVVRCFEITARARPRVLLIEDLHWADSATVAMWEFVARRARTMPLLLLATLRDEAAPLAHPARSAFRRLQLHDDADEVPLDGLTTDDVEELVARLPDAVRASAPPADALHRRSEGNPFVLGLALESGGATSSVSLTALLDDRIAGLSPAARSVIETAAVVGVHFDVAVVREVGGWPQARVLDALDELLDRKLVRDAATFVRADYAFAHHLIAAHVYGAVSPDRRTRTHRRTGRVLAALVPERGAALSAEVARHLDSGGAGPEAAAYYLSAAFTAHAAFANDETLRLAARAAELATDARLRFDARALIEEVHDRVGDRAAQGADLEALEEAARLVDDVDARFEVARRSAHLLAARAQRADEAQAVAQLERIARESTRVVHRADAALARAKYLQAVGDLSGAAEATAFAADVLADAGEHRRAIVALGLGAEVDATMGRFGDARARVARALAIAADTGDPAAVASARASGATVDFIARDFEAAGEGAALVLAESERIGDRAGAADAHARLAAIEARRFRHDVAREHFAQARDAYASLGDGRGVAVVSLNAGIVEYSLADFNGAMRHFTEALELFAQLGDLRGEALAASNAALAYVRCAALEDAARLASRAEASATRLDSPIVWLAVRSTVAEVALHRGKIDVAVTMYERVLHERRRTTTSRPDIAEDLAGMTRAYLAAGRIHDASAHAAELAELLPDLDEALFFPHHLWFAAAEAFQAAGAVEQARGAQTTAHRLLAERTERLSGADRARYAAVPEHMAIANAANGGCPRSDGARTL